ncbi:MAG: ABC transporter ATP-binding protein [Lentisphaeria bacterium]|nr:ABC transporter ATP-binding protein [Lentisphaeria bacterium]
MKILKMIRQILAPKYKFAALVLIVMMSIGALLEIAALAMLMPLVTAFAQPELFHSNKYLKAVYEFVSPSSLQQFMIYAAATMIITYLLKNIYNFAFFYAQTWYTKKITLNFTNRVYQNTVEHPYEYFLNVDNSELINRISQIGTFGQTFLIPFFIMLSEIMVLLVLGTAIIILVPEIAVAVFVSSLLVLGSYYLLTRKIIERNGKKMHLALSDLLMQLTLTFNAIKEIKLAKNESYFRSQVHDAQNRYMQSIKNFYDIGNIPRMLLESWTVMIAMGILIYMLANGESTAKIIFLAAFFLGATFRILPSLTRIQHNLFSVKQYYYLFTLIHESLCFKAPGNAKMQEIEEFDFNKELVLENLSFAYPNGDGHKIINDFNLTVKANECIAFTGVSGCGKTTLIDLVCGLLKPASGTISVDGRDIQEILTSWQKSIGYVPQEPSLFNLSLRENIALGIPANKIDNERLNEVVKLARIDNFIQSLPDGLNSCIGGKNIRLSGGQKQRIAIARALYRNPKILIMDEATSALDAATEAEFADSIISLKGKVTILMIAHREKMVAVCDREIRLG